MAAELFESGSVFEGKTVPFAGDVSGRRLVVLYQDDDSMTRQHGHGPSFPRGTEYVIDIDAKPAVGDFALVRAGDRCVMRQIVANVSGRILSTINPDFDIAPDSGEYFGVLVEAKEIHYRK